MTDQRKSQAEAREARLKQALRDNLKRRKAQIRARTAGVAAGPAASGQPESDGGPSDDLASGTRKTAGIVPDKPTG